MYEHSALCPSSRSTSRILRWNSRSEETFQCVTIVRWSPRQFVPWIVSQRSANGVKQPSTRHVWLVLVLVKMVVKLALPDRHNGTVIKPSLLGLNTWRLPSKLKRPHNRMRRPVASVSVSVSWNGEKPLRKQGVLWSLHKAPACE